MAATPERLSAPRAVFGFPETMESPRFIGLQPMHGATGTLTGSDAIVREEDALDKQVELAKELSVAEKGTSSSSSHKESWKREHDNDDEYEISPETSHSEHHRRRGRKAEAT